MQFSSPQVRHFSPTQQQLHVQTGTSRGLREGQGVRGDGVSVSLVFELAGFVFYTLTVDSLLPPAHVLSSLSYPTLRSRQGTVQQRTSSFALWEAGTRAKRLCRINNLLLFRTVMETENTSQSAELSFFLSSGLADQKASLSSHALTKTR